MSLPPISRILFEARQHSWRATNAVWVAWAAYSLLALAAATPVITSLTRHFGFSRSAERLALELDPAAIAEWFYAGRAESALPFAAAIASGVVLALLISVFVAGGALGQLAGRTTFLQGGSFYFWRFLRLAVFAFIVYFTAFSALSALREAAVRWASGSLVERPAALTGMTLDLLTLVVFWLIAAAFDYAKVRLVTDDLRSASVAGFAGLGFVLRHPWRALAPLAFIALCGAALFAFYQTSYNVFDYRGLRTILISIAGQQLYLLIRLWLRLWQWSACLYVDRALRHGGAAWVLSGPEPHGDNI
jgi:hypothetical protein